MTVPSNLVPTRLTELPQYLGADVNGSIYYVLEGRTYQTQLSTILSAMPGGGTVTSVTVDGGATGLAFTGSPITTSGTIALGGTLVAAHGGTGHDAYSDGQLLIGNSAGGLSKATLTQGPGITITNGDGAITLSSAAAGTVTSVDASGGATGLSFSGGPVTGSGTLTIGGILGLTSGGTGASSAASARVNILPSYTGNAGRVLAVNAGATDVEFITVSGAGTVTSVNASGGATGFSFSGGPITAAGTLTLSGTLAPANGGTGQTAFTDGQLLIGSTAGGTLAKATLTQGSGIAITNGSGSVTIANGAPMTYPGAGVPVSTGSAWDTPKTAPVGALVGTSDAQTLTNKRVTPRVSSSASISSPLAWNSDSFDLYAATAQAGNFTISADAGAPTDGQKVMFRVTCDAAPRTITFTGGVSKGFKPVGVPLGTSGANFTYTATAARTVIIGAIYSAASARWEICALAQEA